MTSPYKLILVACPGNATTAGPEAIHQLVADTNRLGQPAAVAYFPFDSSFDTPPPYRKYNAPVSRYRDEPGNLNIFPEIVTNYALEVRQAQAAIWWMSVNNFTCVRYGHPWRDRIRYFKYFMKGLRPRGGIAALKHLRHFAQSQYALEFLAAHDISAEMLSDPIPVYTSPDYLLELGDKLLQSKRRDRILFNPSKGAKITRRLREAFPNWDFMPLVGYGREELAEIFLNSKLYIDFGHHPGKDRLPREAAIHGCCVITNLNGSAANAVDVPIPSAYKLADRNPGLVASFGALVQQVFCNYAASTQDFEGYRQVIALEQGEFDRQILNAIVIHADERGHPHATAAL